MQLKDLAAGLGISAAMVSKLKRRGMPITSVEAAAKWRRRHLEPTRTKGVRAGTTAPPLPTRDPAPAIGCVSNPGGVPLLVDARTIHLLRQVEELGRLAHDALERGTFTIVAPLLRQAMARVPVEARSRIGLTMEVWDALTAAIPHELAPSDQQAAAGDLDDEFMDTFWQQIALGEYSDQPLAMRTDDPADWRWVPKA